MTTRLAWIHFKSQWNQHPFVSKVDDGWPTSLAKKIAAVVKRCLMIGVWFVLVAATPLLMAVDLPKSLCGKSVEAKTVLDFYKGGRNDRGYTLREIWAFDDKTLEYKHDFIQWLFPLKAPGVNPTAPLTNEETCAAFAADPELRESMKRSFHVMLKFYGFVQKPSGSIERTSNYSTQIMNWLTAGNHNFRRITRILHSLRLHGLDADADAFLQALEGVYRENRTLIGSTIRYWRGA